jgi:DNA-binding transcriptional LysR family regulator
MDVDQLASFLAIVRHGSFRRAAEARHLAQPSLSEQIRRLETELGVRLFDRGRRPVQLTEPGRALAPRAEEIVAAVDEARFALRDFDANHGGTVSVGAMQYLVHLELPDLLADFQERNPNAELRLRIGNTGEIRTMLLEGQIQVAILHAEGATLPKHFGTQKLRTERLVLITAPDGELAQRDEVPWRDLVNESFIVFRDGASIKEALSTAAASAGFVPRAMLESSDMVTAVALVARGLGVAFVPESLARRESDKVAHVQVVAPTVTRQVIIAWDNARYRSRATSSFISSARRILC